MLRSPRLTPPIYVQSRLATILKVIEFRHRVTNREKAINNALRERKKCLFSGFLPYSEILIKIDRF